MKYLQILLFFSILSCSKSNINEIHSPSNNISCYVSTDTLGTPTLSVYLDNEVLITNSSLGINLTDSKSSFLTDLVLVSKQDRKIDETYTMPTGKSCRRRILANETVFIYQNSLAEQMNLRVRVFNDGVAYRFECKNTKTCSVEKETSKLHIHEAINTWNIEYSSGDERQFKLSPSIESIEGKSLSFPVLVESRSNNWILFTESDVSNFPISTGRFEGNTMNYEFAKPHIAKQTVAPNFTSPWRTLIIGNSLKPIVESCLVDHLARPSKISDVSWIEAGVTAFPWWGNNQANSYPDTIKKYIDLASEMNWRFVEFDIALIGSNVGAVDTWKTTPWIKNVTDYGKQKGVLCYGWDDFKNLNTKEKRKEVFSKYKALGVEGIKVDFVNSYTQDTRLKVEELIQDAAKYKLMVSFHGAQSPRGFSRTYPNVITYEAVHGSEYYLSVNKSKGILPQHNCTLPFTRNVIGSMDYTPIAFSSTIRKTTMAHELALGIVFESGWQGMCDTPESYYMSGAKPILSEMEGSWDETRFLDGYPGEYCCLARRKGDKWLVGGINGPKSRSVTLSLPIEISGEIKIYTDSRLENNALKITTLTVDENHIVRIPMQKNGGFSFVAK